MLLDSQLYKQRCVGFNVEGVSSDPSLETANEAC